MAEPVAGVLLSVVEARRLVVVVEALRAQVRASGARLSAADARLVEGLRLALASAGTGAGVSAGALAAGVSDGEGHERHIGTTEAAAILGTTAGNVRDLARRGSLPGQSVSGRWVFSPDIVEGIAAARDWRRS